MISEAKNQQIQLRISAREKGMIMQAALRAGMTMSEWILETVLPAKQQRYQTLIRKIATAKEHSYVFAELNDLLNVSSAKELESILATPFVAKLDSYQQNYLAAMLEVAAHKRSVKVPLWLSEIPGLDDPVFGTKLNSLRMYLLLRAPAPFRRRNIFIDATIGDRV